MINSDMNDILNKIHKVYNRVTEKDIREMILYQKLTLEEIINLLFCRNEINKQLEKNDFDRKKGILVQNSPNVEAREDPDHLEELGIESSGQMIRRPLLCDNNFNFNYLPEICTNDHQDQKSRENCTSSHNSLEVEVHYLRYKTKYCRDKGCKNDCFSAHGFTDFRYLPELLDNEQCSRKDFNLLKKDIKQSKLFKNIIADENVTPLPEKFDLNTYKVIKCPMGESCFVDYHYCYNYHNDKERRRNPKFFQLFKKKYCPNIFSDGKVGDPTKCDKGDYCEYFHTRNEHNYDTNFFQRTLECKRNKGKPCEFFEVCYGIHFNEKGSKITYSDSVQKDEGLNQIKSSIDEVKKNIEKTLQELSKYDTLLVETDKYQIYKCHNPECTQVFSEKMCWLKCKHNFCLFCCDSVNKEKKRYCLACDSFQSAFIFEFKEIANSK